MLVETFDGETIPSEDIFQKFRDCPGLVGKAKIFLFLTCRYYRLLFENDQNVNLLKKCGRSDVKINNHIQNHTKTP